MSTFLQRFRRSLQPKGFTLIELLVVTLIMVLITSTILVRQARFDSSTLLRSLSYSIALSVRSAQVYGTSVLGTTTSQTCAGNSSGNVCYAPAYGVYFSSADPTHYFLFADLNGDGARSAGEDIKAYTLGSGFTISKLCLTVDGAPRCSTDSSARLRTLVIYFKRPNPEARFSSNITGSAYDNAYIQITASSDKANTHAITVAATGQISVLAAGQ